MIVTKKNRCVKKHVIGGSGIFDFIKNIAGKVFSKSGKNVLSKLALSAGKSVAAVAGEHLANKIFRPSVEVSSEPVGVEQLPSYQQTLPSYQQTLPTQVNNAVAQQRANDIISKYILAQPENNKSLNNLINGSGVSKLAAHTASISIQDLVRLKNGSGLKII